MYLPSLILDWGINIFFTGLAIAGRHHAMKVGAPRYLWSLVIISIPFFAIGASGKLEGLVHNTGHRATLEEKLDYNPITRRAWLRALQANQDY